MTTAKQQAHWVLRAQCDDRGALECLLRSVQPSLHRYIHGLIGPAHVDIVQEVMIVICQKIGWLQRAELFRPWMFRIASRAAFRYLRDGETVVGAGS